MFPSAGKILCARSVTILHTIKDWTSGLECHPLTNQIVNLGYEIVVYLNIDCVGLHYSWYSQGIYQLDKW